MKKIFWIFQNGWFFLIAYFFLAKQRFCKYQLIFSLDLKTKDIQWLAKTWIQLFIKRLFFVYFSGTTWATKKLFTSICILVWNAFRWKKNFSNPVKKSADICKNAVLTEESKLLEKIRHFKKLKNVFTWI